MGEEAIERPSGEPEDVQIPLGHTRIYSLAVSDRALASLLAEGFQPSGMDRRYRSQWMSKADAENGAAE